MTPATDPILTPISVEDARDMFAELPVRIAQYVSAPFEDAAHYALTGRDGRVLASGSLRGPRRNEVTSLVRHRAGRPGDGAALLRELERVTAGRRVERWADEILLECLGDRLAGWYQRQGYLPYHRTGWYENLKPDLWLYPEREPRPSYWYLSKPMIIVESEVI